ncbi:M20/M25/M40 family metallo-hydrolase [Mesotoga prima]|uniref:Peptidase family protein n=1 Tax=Mesotoga prima MesG1.Ag.4.2 TaxID=660470 RepID=I2F5H2_9BACT|nr:M20/M25/M40 family metallo-hydrolase [Mesotoga prima]CCU83850.1 Peptidase M42 family protein [Mesotoga infera]AFK07175.1 peptidase family protein [Mesotoga prima MesG1.Ag.4.2]HOZ99033.1 M20/M25/M40 family metallo-hydrolase [Mesotoga prima]HQN60982.1 M20/M25/M40 family metallo-hydrolase [Mesotoga prima]HUM22155.1 M20/M25/M40 family metallo-hydrolase [Mesotoga prima]
MNLDRLTEVVFVPGMTGREEMIRAKIIEMLPEGVEPFVDDLGNVVLEVGNGDSTIAFAAHMDEIGLLVTGVNSDGSLSFKKVGGIADELLVGRHLDVITSSGESIDGVIGMTPPHLREKTDLSWQNQVIDVGTSSKEETASLGIEVLDYAVFRKQISILNDKYVAVRSLDDRSGCLALLDLLDMLMETDLDRRIVFAWTVQEEIGLIGARALSERLKPNLFFPVDSFACCSRLTGDVKPGNGPVLRMSDTSSLGDYGLGKRLMEFSRERDIPLQMGVTGGGTDGIPFQQKGKKMVPLAMAVKYLHSETEYISMEDYDNLVRLMFLISTEFTV